MLELIVDSCDRENDAIQALLAAGISAVQGECVNVIRVPECNKNTAEACMTANGIEWQWSCNEDGHITVS